MEVIFVAKNYFEWLFSQNFAWWLKHIFLIFLKSFKQILIWDILGQK